VNANNLLIIVVSLLFVAPHILSSS